MSVIVSLLVYWKWRSLVEEGGERDVASISSFHCSRVAQLDSTSHDSPWLREASIFLLFFLMILHTRICAPLVNDHNSVYLTSYYWVGSGFRVQAASSGFRDGLMLHGYGYAYERDESESESESEQDEAPTVPRPSIVFASRCVHM